MHRRTATVTANSPPLDYEDSSHIATQSERAAEFPFSISCRPLCSASLLVLSSLSLPALLLSLVSLCVVLCGCSFRPFRRSLLRHCASSLLCAASLALSLRSGVGAIVGMKATARTGAVVLGCRGCFATAFFFRCSLDLNKKGRFFTRASPPAASGRLRPPPAASGHLRPPPPPHYGPPAAVRRSKCPR